MTYKLDIGGFGSGGMLEVLVFGLRPTSVAYATVVNTVARGYCSVLKCYNIELEYQYYDTYNDVAVCCCEDILKVEDEFLGLITTMVKNSFITELDKWRHFIQKGRPLCLQNKELPADTHIDLIWQNAQWVCLQDSVYHTVEIDWGSLSEDMKEYQGTKDDLGDSYVKALNILCNTSLRYYKYDNDKIIVGIQRIDIVKIREDMKDTKSELVEVVNNCVDTKRDEIKDLVRGIKLGNLQ